MPVDPKKEGKIPPDPGTLTSATMRVDLVGEASAVPDLRGPEEEQEYTVQLGDTAETISRHFYGDSSQYKRILEANNLTDPGQLKVGDRLVIPRRQE